jgi:hypothetical protein
MRSARGDVNTAPKRGSYAWYWMNHIAQDIMGKPAPAKPAIPGWNGVLPSTKPANQASLSGRYFMGSKSA